LVETYSVESPWDAPPQYAQQFNSAADGNGGFTITPLNDPVQLPNAFRSIPVAEPDGSFVAIVGGPSQYWVGGEAGTIFEQHFAADDTPIDQNQVSPDLPSAAFVAGAGLDQSGNLYVGWYIGNIWQPDMGDGTAPNLYAQEIRADGTKWASPLQITPTPADASGTASWAAASLAVGPDGSLLAGWTTGGIGVEARRYDPIMSSTTETDTLTIPSSPYANVQVKSQATTFGDTVLWEYWVTNNTTHTMGQFSVGGAPAGVTDTSSSIGWADDGTGTGWAAGPSDTLLAPGQTAYFTFTTPSAYAAGPVTAQAGVGTWNNPASGTLQGPNATETETSVLTTGVTYYGEQKVKVVSTATEFDDHILWQYELTNLSYAGMPEPGLAYPGVLTFDVPHPEGVAVSNVTVPAGWDSTDSDESWDAGIVNSDAAILVGGRAYFSFTTPLAAIGQVWVGASQGHWGSAGAAANALGAVAPHPAILLKSLAYSGTTFSTVYRDAGPAYDAPQWFDANEDGSAANPELGDRNYPVTFARNDTVNFKVTVKLTGGVPPNDGSDLYLVGFGPDGINTPIYDFGRPFGNRTWTWTAVAMTPLPSFVHSYDAGFNVNWSYKWSIGVPTWDPAGWSTFATSNNPLYVTYAKSQSTAYRSLVYNATVSAEGKSTWQDVLNADWATYAQAQSGGNGLVWREPKAAPPSPGTPTIAVAAQHFFYWGNWNTPSRGYQSILSDGDGECGGWANFWKQELLVQGITEVSPTIVLILAPLGEGGMLISNWGSVPSVLGRSGDASHPYLKHVQFR
jgi:hypothetical protein